MKIMVAGKNEYYQSRPVENYSRSMTRALRDLGHDVMEVPRGRLKNEDAYNRVDLLLDIDCGRDSEGGLGWHCQSKKVPCRSAVLFIDSHGHPTAHKRLAPNYDHVFFAVYAKRDLFAKHPSAHWSPNFTDRQWFDGETYPVSKYAYDFGFFGSKGGLDRAKPLIEIANDQGWTHHVGQICPGGKHQWPNTAVAMAACKNLFNHQQKHDGPNLRVLESMAMKRPLVCDNDPSSGMDRLFTPGVHYIPYESYTYNGLKEAMQFVMNNPKKAETIAELAYERVKKSHLVEHRIEQIMEVVIDGI